MYIYIYIYIYVYVCIYIYIYIYIGVRGSPERDILSLGTLGDGAWPGWGVLPPAPSRPWPGLARPGHFEK